MNHTPRDIPRRRPIVAGLLALSCALSIHQDRAQAADCAYYIALIEDQAFERVEGQLPRDTQNRACAYHLAKAYWEEGNRPKAIEWINLARLFANRERDGDLFYSVLYLKLALAPDSPLQFQDIEDPQAYEPEPDYARLKREKRDLFDLLQDEFGKRYEEEVELFEANPWNAEECPITSDFWNKIFKKKTSDFSTICEKVKEVKSLRAKPEETRESIIKIADALEALEKVSVDISDYREQYPEKAAYYEALAKADDNTLSAAERSSAFKEAIAHLDSAQLSDWDPAHARDRYQKAQLVASIEKELAKPDPPNRETIKSWVKEAKSLKEGFRLSGEYSTAVDLWDGWSECRHSTCYEKLCPEDPCLAFSTDSRAQDAEYLGKERLQDLKAHVVEAIQEKTNRYTSSLDSYFSSEDPTVSNGDNADRILSLLDEHYSKYSDADKILEFKKKAKADNLIAQSPPSIRNADPDWLESLRAFQLGKLPYSSYGASLLIIKHYDQCAHSIGKPLDKDDPCLKLVHRWESSDQIRRRSQVKKYFDGAQRLLGEKTKRILGELVDILNDNRASIEAVNEQIELMDVYYSDYIDSDSRSKYNSARNNHPKSLEIQKLVAPASSTGQAAAAEMPSGTGSILEPTRGGDSAGDKDTNNEDRVKAQDPPLDTVTAHAEPIESTAEDSEATIEDSRDHRNTELEDEPRTGSTRNECDDMDSLHARISKSIPLFKTAYEIWQSKGRRIPPDASPRLVAAMRNLLESDLTSPETGHREQISMIDDFNKWQREIELNDRDHAVFVRNYFTAWRYLNLEDSDGVRRAVNSVETNGVIKRLPKEAEIALRCLEALSKAKRSGGR